MLNLVRHLPGLEVRIISGLLPGALEAAILENDCTRGTVIRSD